MNGLIGLDSAVMSNSINANHANMHDIDDSMRRMSLALGGGGGGYYMFILFQASLPIWYATERLSRLAQRLDCQTRPST